MAYWPFFFGEIPILPDEAAAYEDVILTNGSIFGWAIVLSFRCTDNSYSIAARTFIFALEQNANPARCHFGANRKLNYFRVDRPFVYAFGVGI